MWSYHGGKTNIVERYPRPKHSTLIEPFAGSAQYSLKYFDRDVLLVDKYDVIIKIWKWLQQCSENDIYSLPKFKAGDNINNHNYDCEEQRMLVGFLVGFGFTHPRKTATPRLRNRPNAYNYNLKKVASQLFKIRHWKFQCSCYSEIPNQKATWFIDPPYQFGGHAYVKSNKHIDFNHLGEWCKERDGQVIVCENMKAGWLPFKPMVQQNVLTGKYQEAIWSNEPTEFDNIQTSLF